MKEPIYQGLRRDLITLLAGPVAEAKYSKRALISVVLAGGHDDYARAIQVAEYLPEGKADIDSAEAEARYVIRKYWGTVEAIAVALQARRKLDGEELEAIIQTATGEGWRGYMCHLDRDSKEGHPDE